jgi:hypothetical protein
LAVNPPPPPVLLPRSLVELASVYEADTQRVASVDPMEFTNGDRVAAALKTAEGYETDQFQKGMTVYGAIVALQDPTFVSAVREFAKDPAQRSQVAARIMADPSYAATFKGADSAAGLVMGAFSETGKKMIDQGGRIRQSAYDVQRQSWSKADVADRPGRLALAKSLSAERQQAIEVSTIRLADNAAGKAAMGLTAPPAAPPYTPLVNRSLALAAMAALGEGGEEYTPQLNGLLADNVEGQCLQLAKLNLYQCLAVAKPHYEDVFCLGQHAVTDTGQCVMKGSQPGYVIPSSLTRPAGGAPPPEQVAGKSGGKKKSSSKSAKAG